MIEDICNQLSEITEHLGIKTPISMSRHVPESVRLKEKRDATLRAREVAYALEHQVVSDSC